MSVVVKTMPSQAVLDESQLSVVALPPTPLKTDTASSPGQAEVVSTVSSQILPLHRLSGSSLPQVNKTSPGQESVKAESKGVTKSKPVAEVSPFSNTQELDDTDAGYHVVPNNSMAVETLDTSTMLSPSLSCPNNTMVMTNNETMRRENSVTSVKTLTREESVKTLVRQTSDNTDSKSPVKEKLDKMRRSITEPLIQYFHDITLVSSTRFDINISFDCLLFLCRIVIKRSLTFSTLPSLSSKLQMPIRNCQENSSIPRRNFRRRRRSRRLSRDMQLELVRSTNTKTLVLLLLLIYNLLIIYSIVK